MEAKKENGKTCSKSKIVEEKNLWYFALLVHSKRSKWDIRCHFSQGMASDNAGCMPMLDLCLEDTPS